MTNNEKIANFLGWKKSKYKKTKRSKKEFPCYLDVEGNIKENINFDEDWNLYILALKKAIQAPLIHNDDYFACQELIEYAFFENNIKDAYKNLLDLIGLFEEQIEEISDGNDVLSTLLDHAEKIGTKDKIIKLLTESKKYERAEKI